MIHIYPYDQILEPNGTKANTKLGPGIHIPPCVPCVPSLRARTERRHMSASSAKVWPWTAPSTPQFRKFDVLWDQESVIQSKTIQMFTKTWEYLRVGFLSRSLRFFCPAMPAQMQPALANRAKTWMCCIAEPIQNKSKIMRNIMQLQPQCNSQV
jgi:hypothetical protein